MRGSCIHTLKDKLFEHHIWRNIRWRVKCWRSLTVSSLYFIYRYSQTHIDTQRPHHHMLIIMTWKIKILNIYVYFYFKFSWQVFASTQWNGKKNITTYWQTSLPGLNDEQVQFVWNSVAFAGVHGHTFIDRLRHHHTLIDGRPMG